MSLDVVDGVFMSLGFRALPIIENEEEQKILICLKETYFNLLKLCCFEYTLYLIINENERKGRKCKRPQRSKTRPK